MRMSRASGRPIQSNAWTDFGVLRQQALLARLPATQSTFVTEGILP